MKPVFLIGCLLACTLLLFSCKHHPVKVSGHTDTASIKKRIVTLDLLLCDTTLATNTRLHLGRELAYLCHSIGLWQKWGSTVLAFADPAFNSSASKLGIHQLLDSVISLRDLHTTDTGINKVIANAIWKQYLFYGFSEQLYRKQLHYSEMFLSDSSTIYLPPDDYKSKIDYLKINHGEIYVRLGEYPKARAIQQHYLNQAIVDGKVEARVVYTYTLCNTLNKMELWHEALQKIKKVENFTNVSNATRTNVFLVMIETLENLNDSLNAMPYYQKALEITAHSSDADDIYSYAQGLTGYGFFLAAQNKLDAAIYNFKKSIVAYSKLESGNTREIAKNQLQISKCYLDKNNTDTAKFYNDLAIQTLLKIDVQHFVYDSIYQMLKEENTLIDVFDNKAVILQRQYQQKPNIDKLKEIIEVSKISFTVQWLLLSGYDFSESFNNENDLAKLRSQRAIDACYQLYQQTNDPKWPLAALEMAEKSKAIVLQQTLKRQLAATNIGNDTLLAGKRMLEEQLAMLADTADLSAAGADSLAAEKNSLAIALNNIQNQLNIKYPNFKTALSKEDSFDMALVEKKLLDGNTALLEYFVDTATNYVFCATKGGNITMHILPKTAMDVASKWQQYFANKNAINNNFTAFCKDGWAVYQQLFPAAMQQALAKADINNIVLIPDAGLGFIPFDALLTAPVAGTMQATNIPYLINRFSVSNGYSAQSLLLRKERRLAAGAAIFAPVFLQQQRGLAPLKYSQDEAAIAMQAVDNANGYIQQKATLQAFTKNLPDRSLIHLATHASAGDSTEPAIEFYDSSLGLSRIYTLPVRANLVVLSACQTGIGRLQTGEGPLSLARGFYYAGARQVITSLWNVDDKSNAAIFKNFYQNDWKGRTGTALRQAKIDYIKNAGDTKASPYYWAGMVIFGTDDKGRDTSWVWLTALAAAVICLVLVYFFKRKNQRT